MLDVVVHKQVQKEQNGFQIELSDSDEEEDKQETPAAGDVMFWDQAWKGKGTKSTVEGSPLVSSL